MEIYQGPSHNGNRLQIVWSTVVFMIFEKPTSVASMHRCYRYFAT